MSDKQRLVADAGGTNIRLALYDESSGQFSATETLSCIDYPGFADAITAYLQMQGSPAPASACFAVAAILDGDQVEMTNACWSFSASELAGVFNFDKFAIINDFAAIAQALPHLQQAQLQQLTPALPAATENLLAIGPGTGLGGALFRREGEVIPCEPGHAGLSPATPLELEIFKLLQPHAREIYAEYLLSGPGLERLYQSVATIKGVAVEALTAAEVSLRAQANSDDVCREALGVFCDLLGSTAGDFAVFSGSYGGCYIGGGIVPRFISFLEQSNFQQRFINKGAMRGTLEQVPLYVILDQYPGLLGAATFPLA